MDQTILLKTIQALDAPGKGILAADESTPTMTKRLMAIGVTSTETSRRDYRELLFRTPHLGDTISGVILYEETLKQNAADGTPLTTLLKNAGIVPGIKVDLGITPLPGTDSETITQGLDGLADRLQAYRELGARFAKWRAVLNIDDQRPSALAIAANADTLGRYAALCQAAGIVPMVEPELLMDGEHTLERCAEATEAVLTEVFTKLREHKVFLEGIILKPNMVLPGTRCSLTADIDTVAQATLTVLKRTVPAAVPSINFLSGGQADELATAHLAAMNQAQPLPWHLSFSYGRALQAPALAAWAGDASQAPAAQAALVKRAKLNSLATLGQYTPDMETADEITS